MAVHILPCIDVTNSRGIPSIHTQCVCIYVYIYIMLYYIVVKT